MQKIIAIAAVSVVTATTQPERTEVSDIDTVVLSTAPPEELVASLEVDEIHTESVLLMRATSSESFLTRPPEFVSNSLVS